MGAEGAHARGHGGRKRVGLGQRHTVLRRDENRGGQGGRWDPEGLLSTVPAIATALSGVIAGRWIADARRSSHERASGLFVAGVALIAVGFA